MQWEIVIGLETHVQLLTQSKLFSNTSTKFGSAPNTQANQFDLALPGVLPVLNSNAVECAIRFGLAINATISTYSVFERKNYFYPDLPKGYQISQYRHPILQGGNISFEIFKNNQYEIKTIQLHHAHLEEDAGKSLHTNHQNMTGIDLNRAGMPLLEIVTKPNISSAAEAIAYAKALHLLVIWLKISDGSMENGSFRCDVNVSVRHINKNICSERCEIKNLNSFRFMEEAINYEVNRQIQLMENGGQVLRSTCLYDPSKKKTCIMRSKESAQDYRYFPDPDLLPLIITQDWIKHLKSLMPELPYIVQKRFIHNYALSKHEAVLLTQSQALAIYFEEIVLQDKNLAKLAVNWLISDMAFALNKENINITLAPVNASQLVILLQRVNDGTISNKIAKIVFSMMWKAKSSKNTLADDIINTHHFKQISNTIVLEKIIDKVLLENNKLVTQFHDGKTHTINALIGKIMQITCNKADPSQLIQLLRKKL